MPFLPQITEGGLCVAQFLVPALLEQADLRRPAHLGLHLHGHQAQERLLHLGLPRQQGEVEAQQGLFIAYGADVQVVAAVVGVAEKIPDGCCAGERTVLSFAANVGIPCSVVPAQVPGGQVGTLIEFDHRVAGELLAQRGGHVEFRNGLPVVRVLDGNGVALDHPAQIRIRRVHAEHHLGTPRREVRRHEDAVHMGPAAAAVAGKEDPVRLGRPFERLQRPAGVRVSAMDPTTAIFEENRGRGTCEEWPHRFDRQRLAGLE